MDQLQPEQKSHQKLQRLSNLFNSFTFRKNKILVRRLSDPGEVKTRGGLYIPDKWTEKIETENGIEEVEVGKELPQICEVVAVGPMCKDLKRGDLVLIPMYTETTVRFSIEGETFLTLTEDDVLLKIED